MLPERRIAEACHHILLVCLAPTPPPDLHRGPRDAQSPHGLVHTDPFTGQKDNARSHNLLLRTGSLAHDRFEFFPMLFTDFECCGSESSHGSRCVAEFSPAFLSV